MMATSNSFKRRYSFVIRGPKTESPGDASGIAKLVGWAFRRECDRWRDRVTHGAHVRMAALYRELRRSRTSGNAARRVLSLGSPTGAGTRHPAGLRGGRPTGATRRGRPPLVGAR